ncbi:MAG: 3-phosphoshikimate 1-carboxyvinyltransferase [Planctomycetes bacterium]|nr:3-phosphoshikimate 1-carboxyvinyltransferase [Planctomycetota bacterium]MCG2685302.1 3-phosphoshikimate 1-carboxyvinyltransferase [Planctomycetales bacterium]
MVDYVEIRPSGPLKASIRPPGSKSITNRALVCAALAEGESVLTGALDCDDTRAMIEALLRLGIAVEHDRAAAAVRVTGRGGELPSGDVKLYAADSGTTARFLTAVAALGHGTYRIDGSPRLRRRPIGDLLDALGQLGAEAVSESGNGCPPVVVRGRGLRGGRATLAGDVSSQFLSGLLMAAPYAETDVELAVVGNLVSRPFVDMTLAVMASFGVVTNEPDARRFIVSAHQRYRAGRYEIEPDATAAGYFLAAAAITQGEVTVEGLSRGSQQGDLAFCECLRRMGCEVRYDSDRVTVAGRPLHGIEIDMGAISDVVPTLAAAALFAAGPTTIRGVAHIRRKESDRIGDLAAELRKFGAEVEEHRDGLTITPRPLRGAEVDPHDDHRLAMSLALVGLVVPGVIVRNPGCVAKTYPSFFRNLKELSAR